MNQTWYGVFPVYLECKAKTIFDVAGIGAEVMCFKCCLVFFKKNHKYRLKNGRDAFRASRLFGALPTFSPRCLARVFVSLVSRVLSLVSCSSRVLSRCLIRVSRCLARLSLRSFGLSL